MRRDERKARQCDGMPVLPCAAASVKRQSVYKDAFLFSVYILTGEEKGLIGSMKQHERTSVMESILKKVQKCLYCNADMLVPEDAGYVYCEACGRGMEIARFTEEERRLTEEVERARIAAEHAEAELHEAEQRLLASWSSEAEKVRTEAMKRHSELQIQLNTMMSTLQASKERYLQNHFMLGEMDQREGRFADAIGHYQQVMVGCDQPEAEVHWRILLCRNGVEYVQEPHTGRWLPTVMNMNANSILHDKDYSLVIQFARTAEMRDYYTREAKRIEDILAKYREVYGDRSSNQYDVFISVKQSAESDQPTGDSETAMQLYNQLCAMNLHVFNSRVSLVKHVGEEYEPYIMAALRSAKLMIVVGHKAAHLRSPWVRNEWRRFLWLKNNTLGQRRLVAYIVDMDRKDMPHELGALQIIDTSVDPQPMETLKQAVYQMFPEKRGSVHSGGGISRPPVSDECANMLKIAEFFLSESDYKEVSSICEKVLEKGYNAQAYLLKLCVERRVRFVYELGEQEEELTGSQNYKYALHFASREQRVEIQGYNDQIRERIRMKAEAAEAQKRAEEEAKKKAEEDAKKKAEEEAQKLAEEEALRRKKILDELRIAQEVAKKKAEADAKKKAEEEAKKKAEEEARKQAEARKKTEEELRRQKVLDELRAAQEAAKKKAEAETGKKADDEEERRRQQILNELRAAQEAAKKKSDGTVDTLADAQLRMQHNRSCITAGAQHSVVLRSDGSTAAKGYNADRQCDVQSWRDLIAVSAGSYHTVGLKRDGAVVATGNNKHKACNVQQWSGIIEVAAGARHTLGLKADGTVIAAGENGCGECSVEHWRDMAHIYCNGSQLSLGLKRDGTVLAAGFTSLGAGDVQDWTDMVDLATNSDITIGVRRDGTLRITKTGDANWKKISEKLKDEKNVVQAAVGFRFAAVLHADGTVRAAAVNSLGHEKASAWTDIVAIACGGPGSTLLGLRRDGTVLSAGLEASDYYFTGVCVRSAAVDSPAEASPVPLDQRVKAIEAAKAAANKASDDQTQVQPAEKGVSLADTQLSMELNRGSISAGSQHQISLRADGSAAAKGYNSDKQCNVQSWRNLIAVSAGSYHTVGLMRDGTVIATGNNKHNACNVQQWSGVVEVAAGARHTLGLKADGTVIAAGENGCGECRVEQWRDVAHIYSNGSQLSLGLKRDGTVLATGLTHYGAGNVYGWTDIVHLATNGEITIGVKRDGTLKITNGSDAHWKKVAQELQDEKNVVQAAVGFKYAVVLRADGTVGFAGQNNVGQDKVSGWKDIVAITCGGTGSTILGLRKDGVVLSAGLDANSRFFAGVPVRTASDSKSAGASLLPPSAAVKEIRSPEAGNEEIADVPKAKPSSPAKDSVALKFVRGASIATVGGQTVAVRENGTLYTSGDASHGKLKVQGWRDIRQVATAEKYTFGLMKNGKVVQAGGSLIGAKCRTSDWTDIVQISACFGNRVAGLRRDGTVVCSGMGGEASRVSGWSNIVHVNVGGNGIIGVKADGTVVSAGLSQEYNNLIEKWKDVVMTASYYNIVAGVHRDGTVLCASGNADMVEQIKAWKDIVLLRCASSTLVGLRADGTVAVALDKQNKTLEQEVAKWKDIVDISIAYGRIYGVTKDGMVLVAGNNYDQDKVSQWKDVRSPELFD